MNTEDRQNLEETQERIQDKAAKFLMRAASMLIKHCNENNIALRSGDTDFLRDLSNTLEAAEGAFEPWLSDEEMLREMEQDEEKLTALTWGERCGDYEPLCSVCVAWRMFDETKRAPFDDEVIAAVNATHRERVK